MDERRTHHLTVFGATGFTARMIMKELIQGTPSRWPPGFTWSIAGRNRSALEKLRSSLFDHGNTAADGSQTVPIPEIVIADVRDEQTLTAMAQQTRLLLNCVGPYRDYGEPVVKACIHACTDYLDLCGEPGFIERMHFIYHDAASRAGITICHAAAFDSVPCDLGVNLCKKLLAEKGAYPSSVEVFFSLKTKTKFVVHYATYEAAIKGFSSTKELRQGRKELARVRPKPTPVGSALPGARGGGFLARFGISRDERISGWLVPYFFSDPAVVRLSQMIILHMTNKSEAPMAKFAPVHFAAYIQFLAVRAWGRNLLYKYPSFFTWGLVQKEDIEPSQLNGTVFTETFYAKGYSDALHPTTANTPDVNLAIRIIGPEPGYKATSVIFLEAASLLLRRRNAVRKGVLTPAAAFGHLDQPNPRMTPGVGGVLNALQNDGRVTWNIVNS